MPSEAACQRCGQPQETAWVDVMDGVEMQFTGCKTKGCAGELLSGVQQ